MQKPLLKRYRWVLTPALPAWPTAIPVIVTTEEEYARQHYEGGHTLYGPNTNAFIAEHCVNWPVRWSASDAVFEGPEKMAF